MGKMTRDEVLAAMRELSEIDREILLIDLMEEMETVDPAVERAWVEEAKRRQAEIESGAVKTISMEELQARMQEWIDGKDDSDSPAGAG
jgi:hypothetical protein